MNIDQILPDILNTVPNWARIGFGLLALLFIICAYFWNSIMRRIKEISVFLRDLYYKLKKILFNKYERKRIETLINWKKGSPNSKINYASKKVKIKNVYHKKNEDAFIEASKKTYVAVIATKFEKNKSDNLLRSVISWVTIDFLYSIRKFLNPELTTALVHREIINQLRQMRDYGAEKKFITFQSALQNQDVNEFIDHLDELDVEGIYDNLLLPYLRRLALLKIKIPRNTQKESDELVLWLDDVDERLLKVSKFKFFPRTSFVYVKRFFIPEERHLKRVISNFETDKCEVVVISGWLTWEESIKNVANKLNVNYEYPIRAHFRGNRLTNQTESGDEDYSKRLSYILTRKDFDFNEL